MLKLRSGKWTSANLPAHLLLEFVVSDELGTDEADALVEVEEDDEGKMETGHVLLLFTACTDGMDDEPPPMLPLPTTRLPVSIIIESVVGVVSI